MDGITAIKVSDIATLVPLGIAVGLGILFFWVIWRTESWHMLRRRIWLLVHGKEEISDPGIRDYVEEQNNLAAFHVFAGVQVTTLAEVRTLMAWCKARSGSRVASGVRAQVAGAPRGPRLARGADGTRLRSLLSCRRTDNQVLLPAPAHPWPSH